MLASTVSDNPQIWLRLAHGADTIVNTQTECGQATPSEVCLEDMGHPTAAGLSIREQVQMCAFIPIQPQALSNWPGSQKSVAGQETLCPGPLLQGFLPIMEPEQPVWCPSISSPQFTQSFSRRLALFNNKALLPFQSTLEDEAALIKHK